MELHLDEILKIPYWLRIILNFFFRISELLMRVSDSGYLFRPWILLKIIKVLMSSYSSFYFSYWYCIIKATFFSSQDGITEITLPAFLKHLTPHQKKIPEENIWNNDFEDTNDMRQQKSVTPERQEKTMWTPQLLILLPWVSFQAMAQEGRTLEEPSRLP